MLLADLGPTLSDGDKEDIALMGLKVVAADGHRHFAEMEQFNTAMTAVGYSTGGRTPSIRPLFR